MDEIVPIIILPENIVVTINIWLAAKKYANVALYACATIITIILLVAIVLIIIIRNPMSLTIFSKNDEKHMTSCPDGWTYYEFTNSCYLV